MAKSVATSVLDAALNAVRGAATRMVVCAGAPTSYADITTRRLAEAVMTVNTDYTLANGDVSGRKFTTAAKTGVAITVSGTADHIVLADGSTNLLTTTCASQALSSDGTVDIPGWKAEIQNPT